MPPPSKRAKGSAKRARSTSRKKGKTSRPAPSTKKKIVPSSPSSSSVCHESMADRVDPRFLRKQMSLTFGQRYEYALRSFPASWRYEMIIIDPPWNELFKTKSEIALKDVTDLPVRDMASRNGCSLFVWTSPAFLPEAIDLIVAWGFKYVGVWYITMDLATRKTHFLLLGQTSPKIETTDQDVAANTKRNGDPLTESAHRRKAQPPPHVSIDQVAESAEKKIRRTLGPASRLRLFASDREEPGWSSWGPDVPGFYQDKPNDA